MYFYSNVFAELAARVRGGDLEAKERLRQELETALVVIVRQTLRDGRSVTSLGRRILAVARRLDDRQGGGVQDGDDFEREVAHCVCDDVVSRLRPCQGGLPAGDSVRLTAHEATLVAC